MSAQPTYEVMVPTGKHVGEPISPAGPLPTLEGKKIGFVWISFTNGGVLTDALIGLLAKRLSNTEFVKVPSGKGSRWGEVPNQSVGAAAREAGVDAVVVTVGG